MGGFTGLRVFAARLSPLCCQAFRAIFPKVQPSRSRRRSTPAMCLQQPVNRKPSQVQVQPAAVRSIWYVPSRDWLRARSCRAGATISTRAAVCGVGLPHGDGDVTCYLLLRRRYDLCISRLGRTASALTSEPSHQAHRDRPVTQSRCQYLQTGTMPSRSGRLANRSSRGRAGRKTPPDLKSNSAPCCGERVATRNPNSGKEFFQTGDRTGSKGLRLAA
jgi:hypothetical protein